MVGIREGGGVVRLEVVEQAVGLLASDRVRVRVRVRLRVRVRVRIRVRVRVRVRARVTLGLLGQVKS